MKKKEYMTPSLMVTEIETTAFLMNWRSSISRRATQSGCTALPLNITEMLTPCRYMMKKMRTGEEEL